MRPIGSLKIFLLTIALLLPSTKCEITDLSPFQLAMTIRQPDPNTSELMVLFYDSRCKHCSAFLPILRQVDALVQKHRIRVKIARLDTKGHPEFIIAYNLRFFPSLLYFSRGEFKDILPIQLYDNSQQVTKWLNQHLSASHLDTIPVENSQVTTNYSSTPLRLNRSQATQTVKTHSLPAKTEITKLPVIIGKPSPITPSNSPSTAIYNSAIKPTDLKISPTKQVKSESQVQAAVKPASLK